MHTLKIASQKLKMLICKNVQGRGEKKQSARKWKLPKTLCPHYF